MTQENKPVIKQVTHNVDVEYNNQLRTKFNIPGLEFRWVDYETRQKTGWGIWSPVQRNSDIGEKVAKEMGAAADRFSGLNLDSSLFYQGEGTVLAYTTVERANARRKFQAEKTKKFADMIDAAKIRRNVVIPASEGYAQKFKGEE